MKKNCESAAGKSGLASCASADMVVEARFEPLDKKLAGEIAAYIDECMSEEERVCDELQAPRICAIPATFAAYGAGSLEDELDDVEESFAEALFRLIDERGMSDAECYKKAHIDRKTFSKIRTKKDYKPAKTTAAAFAVALELPLDEAKDLIEKAGYSFTHSCKFDIILEYFIKHGKYDIFEINEALYEFGEKILGA